MHAEADVKPDVEPYVPAAHETHADAPAADHVPWLHTLHTPPADDDVPALHGVQDAAPAVLEEPAAHCEHDVAPDGDQLPAEH